ncbi:dUTP diphosphatase [Arcobacter sp. CECT 8985]|uniref:dUTP diphosphatase n=1 Tax=Arcobacter sp. CECT 8985 TaxID=1935424 RepID=UPI00100BB113|nr:dUTP diphosphatase [Arcobacter sp. CECT 8985]RXJ86923.1 hypothetical protein CRU93_05960 [Arcobacter sp. CECT 8985]
MNTNIFNTMVTMQNQFNMQVHKEWHKQGYNWQSAIIAESGELLESWGYKWWKKQEPDLENVKVEAIDILHFIISEQIQIHTNVFGIEQKLETAIMLTSNKFRTIFETSFDFETDIEKNIDGIIKEDSCEKLHQLKSLFTNIDMTNEDIYIAYIVKNCLNKFRQDKGYKSGHYVKNWNGREDNAVAFEIANEWGADDELFDLLYNDLNTYYIENVYSLKGSNHD